MIITKFSRMDGDKVEVHVGWPKDEGDERQFVEALMYDPSVIDVDYIHYVPEDMPLIMNGRIIRK